MITSTQPPTATGRPRRRSSRLRNRLLAAGLTVGVAGAAVVMIVKGSQSTPPPDAPVPSRTYSSSAAPAELLPGDVIPPATGPVDPSGEQDPSAIGSAGDGPAGDVPAATPRILAGDDGHPPRHDGPWTFEGADRLFIQSLGVEAPIDAVGTDHGAMVIPGEVGRVGRWSGGAALDQDDGTVLIAGHVNIAGQGLGALYRLSEIQPGAVVVTTDRTGRRSPWRVTSLESLNKKALPADIFDSHGERRLVLVTCGGALLHIDGPNGGYHTYENNIVARAVPA